MEAVAVQALRVSFLPSRVKAHQSSISEKHRLSISIPHSPCQGPSNTATFRFVLQHFQEWSGGTIKVNHYARQTAKRRPNKTNCLPQSETQSLILTVKRGGKSIPCSHCILPYRRGLSSSRSKRSWHCKPRPPDSRCTCMDKSWSRIEIHI